MSCIAYQASLSMRFSRQEYWSGFSFPAPVGLPDPGVEPGFPALASRFFTTGPLGSLSFPSQNLLILLICKFVNFQRREERLREIVSQGACNRLAGLERENLPLSTIE